MSSQSISLVLVNIPGLIHIPDLQNFLKPCCALQRDFHSDLISSLASALPIWHLLLCQARPIDKAACLEDVARLALPCFVARHFQSRGRYWLTSMNYHLPSFGRWSKPGASLRFPHHDRHRIGHLFADRKNMDRCCSWR
jgi:hypothetical protein